MFRITKKIAIAASIVAFCSGQSNVIGFASDVAELKPGRQVASTKIGTPDPRFEKELPTELMHIILAEASKDTKPVYLASVCKSWHCLMREKKGTLMYQDDLTFAALNPLMKECMNIWWTERFKNGILRYTPPGGKELSLRFSDLENVCKGTFDLANCGNTANNLVITTDVERFFKIGEENLNKAVILIALRQLVEQEINSSAKHFKPLMDSWDVSKAPVGIFWRWGGEHSLSFFDYITASSLSVLSSKNLFENWSADAQNDTRTTHAFTSHAGPRTARRLNHVFHVRFVNQNKDY